MRFAFIVDPLDSLKACKDSSIAMMRAAQDAGHAVWAIQQPGIHWSALHGVLCRGPCIWNCCPTMRSGSSRSRATLCHCATSRRWSCARDPPFDIEYVTTTWLLDRAVAEGARVFNRPQALRDHSEKLSVLEFPQYAAPDAGRA